MSNVVRLANWYRGPLMRNGHGREIAKPGNPAHGWHWVRKTDQGWESTPLAAGGPQHFETAQQAINYAEIRGFEVEADPPWFEYTFATRLPQRRAAVKRGASCSPF
jgi:hypothetical protein